MNLNEQLRQLAFATGLSQRQISKRSGIDPSSISRWMRRERGLSVPAVERVAAALNAEIRPKKEASDGNSDAIEENPINGMPTAAGIAE